MDTLQAISAIAIVEALVITGLLGFLVGTKRRTETFIGRDPKAEVWLPEMAKTEPYTPEAIRQMAEEAEDPKWSEETIDRGVMDIMRMYRDAGRPISAKEAREEVELMLNSQTGEM